MRKPDDKGEEKYHFLKYQWPNKDCLPGPQCLRALNLCFVFPRYIQIDLNITYYILFSAFKLMDGAQREAC